MDTTDITIRPGRAADARALAAMANKLNVFEGKPGDLYSEELVKAQAFGATPLFSVLVAEVDGELVGYAFFHDSYDSEIAAPGVWLVDLFVREQRPGLWASGAASWRPWRGPRSRAAALYSGGACFRATGGRGRSMPGSGPRTRLLESWSWTEKPCAPWRGPPWTKRPWEPSR